MQLLKNGCKKHSKSLLFVFPAEVEINGEILPPLLWAPFRAEITAHIKKGRNSLKIKVTNSLANALLKDGIKQEWKANRGTRWPEIIPPYNERQLEFKV